MTSLRLSAGGLMAHLMKLITTQDALSLYIDRQGNWWSNIQGGPQITRTYLACNWTIIALGGI